MVPAAQGPGSGFLGGVGQEGGTGQGQHGGGHDRRGGDLGKDVPAAADALVKGEHAPQDRDDRVGQGEARLGGDQAPAFRAD